MRKIFVFALLVLTMTTAEAQYKRYKSDRIITSTKAFAVGYQALQDTYLSPEHYHGTELRYISNTSREKDSCRWGRLILNEGWLSKTDSRSGNGGVLSCAYDFRYGVVRTWRLMDDRLKLQAGAQGELTLGAIYNTRNGNNMVNARALIGIGPIVKAEYYYKKIIFSYEVSAPLCGLAFSPTYGQSYYEISEGHYDHNIRVTTPVSVPSLRQQLTVSIPVRHHYITFGYLGDYRQQALGGLKQHIYSHDLIIGMTLCR